MVGKSVATGALVSGAVLAAPAVAETSLRRLANEAVGETFNEVQTLEATFTELPEDFVATAINTGTFAASVVAAINGTEDLHNEAETPTATNIAAANVGQTANMSITAIQGNTITFQYTPDFTSFLTSPESKIRLGEHIQNGGSEEFQRRFADAYDTLAGFRAPEIHAAAAVPTEISSGVLQLTFDSMPVDFVAAGIDDPLKTKIAKKIRDALDLEGLCDTASGADNCVTADNVKVVGSGIEFSFTVAPTLGKTDGEYAVDDRYHNLVLILGSAAAATSAEQDLRNAFRQEVICRLKDETLATDLTLATPSDTVCNEILGISADPDNDGTGESSEESTDESSSARSVAVVSFLSTAAAAAALF